jgi:hypothetical protein
MKQVFIAEIFFRNTHTVTDSFYGFCSLVTGLELAFVLSPIFEFLQNT